jgi:hypothetical protein
MSTSVDQAGEVHDLELTVGGVVFGEILDSLMKMIEVDGEMDNGSMDGVND